MRGARPDGGLARFACHAPLAPAPPPRAPRRQLLFSQDQIGQRKALACKESVDKLHSVRTTTDALDLDAVANWGRIVDAAVTGRMTAVFNG